MSGFLEVPGIKPAALDTALTDKINDTGSAARGALNATFVRFLDTSGNPIDGSLVTIVVDTVLNEISDITVEEI